MGMMITDMIIVGRLGSAELAAVGLTADWFYVLLLIGMGTVSIVGVLAAQSLGSGRASGLLTPSFSVNEIVRTSGGYRRRISNVGFYWAMSQYSDMLASMDWFSDSFFSLTGAFRYRFARQFLDSGRHGHPGANSGPLRNSDGNTPSLGLD